MTHTSGMHAWHVLLNGDGGRGEGGKSNGRKSENIQPGYLMICPELFARHLSTTAPFEPLEHLQFLKAARTRPILRFGVALIFRPI